LSLEGVVVIPIDFYCDSGMRACTVAVIGDEKINVAMTTRAITGDSRPFGVWDRVS
jgi:hypothetical protein